MARRRKSKIQEETRKSFPYFESNPETKRGVLIVLFSATAILLILSFFGIAGNFGDWIDQELWTFFGWDRFLVPILLLFISGASLFPNRAPFSIWNYFGMICFFLSFNGLLNLLIPQPTISDALIGGMIGQFFAGWLPTIIGFWGSLVISVATLLISILLIFNTSLRRIIGIHDHRTGRFGAGLHGDQFMESESEKPFETTEEEEGEEETPESFEVEKPPRAAVMREATEQILTSKRLRKITIPLDLLDKRASKANSGDIERNLEVIERTFAQFGIPIELGETTVGPTVTQYTFRPSQGIKLSRIMALQNDLAYALAAHPIRIEAPIPGKSLVGIEVPNQTVATVSLRELMESKPFENRRSPLSVPLGKDVMGTSWVIPIDKMPHILVAGATGSGKSVCLNTMIISLLYENGPDELRLILVDPKRVELNVYEGIPHLLVPPIMKVDDTVNALKWTVREMERRLDVLSKFGARDITSYNSRAEEKMPRIVIVIDELADLMSASGREVEGSIVRIAQMARATGIHLVIATQRPSVDVITGLIKANIPARVAFSVASQTDSRTILDGSGAEKLLGRGDMLFLSPELSKPKRLQGPFVSDEEIARVVEFLKKDGAPDYNSAVTETARGTTIFNESNDDEPLFNEAVRVILESRKASTSLLQRRLKIGYGRAARIIDLLEEKGIVGPGDGAKPREVLVDDWDREENLKEGMPTADDDYREAGDVILEGRDSNESKDDVV